MIDLASLRRFPDVEAPNLFAVDATDRLLLDSAAEWVTERADDPVHERGLSGDQISVLGDHYGALTLGLADRFGLTGLRSYQDELTGERALAANAARFGLTGAYRSLALGPELLAGARLVVLQLPKGLDELAEIAGLIAEHAKPDVQVLAGGRVKYLTPAMNEVLGRSFETVTAGLARQKSRVLFARDPRAERPPVGFPRQEWHPDEQLWVCAHGGAFAGTGIDIGTRRLIAHLAALPDTAPEETVIDLGCGTGVLATLLARQGRRVIATDRSAVAVASARATAVANEVQYTVCRDDALDDQPDDSAALIVCNPPFHLGAAVHAGGAERLFRGAARVLRPGGQLWTVYNRHLGYSGLLEQVIGPTRVVHRDAKFNVAASRRTAALPRGGAKPHNEAGS